MRGSSGLEIGLPLYENVPELNARWARDILQGMPVLLDAFDGDGRIVVWNAECERVTGYSAADMLGNRRALEILYPDKEYRTFMLEEAWRRVDDDYSSAWELTANDGTQKTVEWFNVGARLKVPGWFQWSIGIDITRQPLTQWGIISNMRRLGVDWSFRDIRPKAQTDGGDRNVLGHVGQMRGRYTRANKRLPVW